MSIGDDIKIDFAGHRKWELHDDSFGAELSDGNKLSGRKIRINGHMTFIDILHTDDIKIILKKVQKINQIRKQDEIDHPEKYKTDTSNQLVDTSEYVNDWMEVSEALKKIIPENMNEEQKKGVIKGIKGITEKFDISPN